MTSQVPHAEPASERDKFEAFFASSRRNRGKGRPNLDTMADGTYADDHTQRHWWTWQQARSHGNVAPSQIADQHLKALLRYTEGFYAAAMEHGMPAGPTANAVAHVERAARSLHALSASLPASEAAPQVEPPALPAKWWTPVGVALPEADTLVWSWDGEKVEQDLFRQRADGRLDFTRNCDLHRERKAGDFITHWIARGPMPTPPGAALSAAPTREAASECNERKLFEAWALEKNYAYRNKHGVWFYDFSEPLWRGWQGGRATRLSEANNV